MQKTINLRNKIIKNDTIMMVQVLRRYLVATTTVMVVMIVVIVVASLLLLYTQKAEIVVTTVTNTTGSGSTVGTSVFAIATTTTSPIRSLLRYDPTTNDDDQRQLQLPTTFGQVDGFILIDADTDLPIFDLVQNNMMIDIAMLPTIHLNVQATIIGNVSAVGSIKFGHNNRTGYRIEVGLPYAFCGDGKPIGNYYPCTNLIIGQQHNISATTYTGNRANGTRGVTKKISFYLVNSSIPPPTLAPIITEQPTSTPSNPPSEYPTTSHPVSTAPIPTCNIPQFLDATWTAFLPEYPTKTSEPMGLFVGDDFVSFSGFIDNFVNTTNQTHARDMTTTDSPWRRMDDIPLAISFTHAPIVRIGMKVYMCGGYLGGHPGPHIAYCFVYDHSIPPGTGQQWTRFTDLPNNGYAGGGMIYDTLRDTLYFTGGGQRLTPGNQHPVDSNRTFKYSLQNPSVGWVETTPIPYAANHLSSVTQTYMGMERHYFVGGQKGENEAKQNVADLYEFIASNETWVQRTFMPFGRGHATASTRSIGCGFIMAGGSINSLTNVKNRTTNIIYYDIPTDSWTSVGDLSIKVHATPRVDIHNNGYIYFVGSKGTNRRRFAAL